MAVESARHRVELLRGLADESEQAVASEAQRVIASVRRQKHAELKKAADAARARLNAAVSEHFPAVIIAEEALRAVSN